MNAAKESFKTVLDAALLRLAETGRGEKNYLLKYAVNLEELKSALREMVFFEHRGECDKRVEDFLTSL